MMKIGGCFISFFILFFLSTVSLVVKSNTMGGYLFPINGNMFVVEDKDGVEYCMVSYLGGFKGGVVNVTECPPQAALAEETNWFYTDSGQIVSTVSDYHENDALAYSCLTKGIDNAAKIELCDMSSMEQKFELTQDYNDKLIIKLKGTNQVLGFYQNQIVFQDLNHLDTPLYIKPTSVTASDEDESLESGLTSLLFRSPVSPVYMYSMDLRLDDGKYLTWDSSKDNWAIFSESKSGKLYYDALNQRIIGFDAVNGLHCLENTTASHNWDWAKFSPCSNISENNLSQQFVLAVDDDGVHNAVLSPVNNSFDYRMFYDNNGANEWYAYFLKKGESTSGGGKNIKSSSPYISEYADTVGHCADTSCSNLSYKSVDSNLDDALMVFKKDVYKPVDGVCDAKNQLKNPPINNLKLDYTQVATSDLKPLLPGQSRIYWLNSGQGTTIVLDSYGGEPTIIDAGTVHRGNESDNQHNERQMTPAQTTELVRNIIRTRDSTVIISHPDSDHYNLLPRIFDTTQPQSAVPSHIYIGGQYSHYPNLHSWFQTLISQHGTQVIDQIQVNSPAANQITGTVRNAGGTMPNTALPNDIHPFGVGSLRLLTSSPTATNSNERSLTAMYQVDDFQALFMADATGATEANLMANHAAMGLSNYQNGIFTASHHGANTHGSNSPALINFLAPALSVIQSGATSYQHPRKETWDTLVGACALAAASLAIELHQYYFFDETSATLQSPDALTSDPVFSTQENGSFIATITSPGGERVPPSGVASQPNNTANTLVDFVHFPNGNTNEVTQSAQTISNNSGQQAQYP